MWQLGRASRSRTVKGSKHSKHSAERQGEDLMDNNKIAPRLHVDFRSLERLSLIRILQHYEANMSIRDDIIHDDLVALVARLFDRKRKFSDADIVNNFTSKYLHSMADNSQTLADGRHARSHELVRPGEQVAAKVAKSNDNGSWILGNVVDYDQSTQTYEIQDEDDEQRVLSLCAADVRRLEDTNSHLRRGDNVLAVFPDTTSFYRAVVVKTPSPPANGSCNWDVIVKFDDDEDESGRAPPRRIPARFVLRRTDEDDSEEQDDDDATD